MAAQDVSIIECRTNSKFGAMNTGIVVVELNVDGGKCRNLPAALKTLFFQLYRKHIGVNQNSQSNKL